MAINQSAHDPSLGFDYLLEQLKELRETYLLVYYKRIWRRIQMTETQGKALQACHCLHFKHVRVFSNSSFSELHPFRTFTEASLSMIDHWLHFQPLFLPWRMGYEAEDSLVFPVTSPHPGVPQGSPQNKTHYYHPGNTNKFRNSARNWGQESNFRAKEFLVLSSLRKSQGFKTSVTGTLGRDPKIYFPLSHTFPIRNFKTLYLSNWKVKKEWQNF